MASNGFRPSAAFLELVSEHHRLEVALETQSGPLRSVQKDEAWLKARLCDAGLTHCRSLADSKLRLFPLDIPAPRSRSERGRSTRYHALLAAAKFADCLVRR